VTRVRRSASAGSLRYALATFVPAPGDSPIYQYSKEGYEDSFLPNGHSAGTPEQALDCAAGLYLNNPTAWLPPMN
jgi:hypothetical protein